MLEARVNAHVAGITLAYGVAKYLCHTVLAFLEFSKGHSRPECGDSEDGSIERCGRANTGQHERTLMRFAVHDQAAHASTKKQRELIVRSGVHSLTSAKLEAIQASWF